ncbi:MAG: hypothetical protein U1F43_14800 [Myxococcota bacterium]
MTARRTRPLCSTALVAALAGALGLVGGAGPARAHGTIPTSNSISFGPGPSGVLLGTNFGGILALDGELRFMCERGVTGEQTSVDVWQWLAGGPIAGIVTTGGFIRGVYLSEPGGCGFVVVPDTDQLLMTDLAPDPKAASGFYAVGASTGSGAEARLLRGTASGASVLASAAGATATSVRAAGDDVYTVFLASDAMTIVHRSGTSEDRWVVAREGTTTLRPLGVDPAAPTTAWFVQSSETQDVLLRTEDGGEHLTPVLTVEARLGGFAIDGQKVWVQSARQGIQASSDGGKTFAPVGGSPHGTCLAVATDKALYACGVPWQDGMALGVSRAGAAFEAVVPYYDGIVGALSCASHPDVTTLCDDELDFLRGYYGFSSPDTSDDASEAAAEVVEPSPEPAAEAGAEVADGGDTAVVEVAPKKDDGCGAARDPGLALGALVGLGLGLAFARRAARRGRGISRAA